MTSDTVSTGDAARSRAVSEPGRGRRRRRPSGEAPPLPRQLNRSGRFWLTLAGAVLAVLILIGVSGVTTVRLDTLEAVPLQLLERLRTAPMTAVFRAVNNAVSPVILLTWWASLLVMVIWRRWRHLFVYIGTMFLVSNLASLAIGLIQRPRPLGVEIIGHWQGFAMPSKPVAVLAATLVNVLYALVPHGRLRDRGKWVVTGLLALVVLARLYLGVDHVSDDLVAIVLGVAIPAGRLAAAGPERRLPRHLPARPGGPPGRDRPPRRGRGPGAERPARRRRHRGQAVRPGGFGRVHPAAHHGQGRAGDVPVREALRGHPPALGPLVQARPHPALRPAGGREAVQHGPPAGPVRGLRAAPDARGAGCRCRSRTASSRSPRSGSTCWSPRCSTGRRRSARSTSTSR